MRLTCPNCSARYEVDPSVIPAEGRDVQCGSCGTTWFQPAANVTVEPEKAPVARDAIPDWALADKDDDDGDDDLSPSIDPDMLSSFLDGEKDKVLTDFAWREDARSEQTVVSEAEDDTGDRDTLAGIATDLMSSSTAPLPPVEQLPPVARPRLQEGLPNPADLNAEHRSAGGGVADRLSSLRHRIPTPTEIARSAADEEADRVASAFPGGDVAQALDLPPFADDAERHGDALPPLASELPDPSEMATDSPLRSVIDAHMPDVAEVADATEEAAMQAAQDDDVYTDRLRRIFAEPEQHLEATTDEPKVEEPDDTLTDELSSPVVEERTAEPETSLDQPQPVSDSWFYKKAEPEEYLPEGSLRVRDDEQVQAPPQEDLRTIPPGVLPPLSPDVRPNAIDEGRETQPAFNRAERTDRPERMEIRGEKQGNYPDLDALKSSLRSPGDDKHERQRGSAGRGRSRFWLGLLFFMFLLALAIGVYIGRDRIAEAVPQAAPYLIRYAEAVDAGRIALEKGIADGAGAVSSLLGQMKGEGAAQ